MSVRFVFEGPFPKCPDCPCDCPNEGRGCGAFDPHYDPRPRLEGVAPSYMAAFMMVLQFSEELASRGCSCDGYTFECKEV